MTKTTLIAPALALLVAASIATPAPAVSTDFTRLVGTASIDRTADADKAGGTYYVAGSTYASLAGQPYAGSDDIFWRSYDVNGTTLLTRQFGSSASDFPRSITADDTQVVVAGFTLGTIVAPLGSRDAVIRNYDLNGNVSWTDQFGTASYDEAWGVTTDGKSVFVTGYTSGDMAGAIGAGDVFLRRYAHAGATRWTRQFGTTSFDSSRGIDYRGGVLYVAGDTDGNLAGSKGGSDAFLRAYTTGGDVLWTKQFGTIDDESVEDVIATPKGPVVVGYTQGDLGGTNAGGYDGFARAFDENGRKRWSVLKGTSGNDYLRGVSAASGGGALLLGQTNGTFPGQVSAGGDDLFLIHVDGNGSQVDLTQIGAAGDETAQKMGPDIATGIVSGSIDGQPFSGGSYDGLVWKISP